MALSDLISRLEQEARSQVQTIEQETEAQVRAIEAATEQAMADTTTRHLERERAEREAVRQRELALARREARARELEARHAQLARVFARARALVPEVASSAFYAEALPSHLDEALSFLEGARPRVKCPAALIAMLRPTVGRHEGVELVIDESVGPGIVAEAADGSVIVDNTLAARLGRLEPRLAIGLLRMLGDGHQ
jgi:vacuolar-type H+-ATPase subunit E/Vma4